MDVPQEETPSGHISRASKPFCLNNLASPIYKIITKKGTTTYQEVADIFVSSLDKSTLEDSKDKTIRRRVYDVINVLIAADLLEKTNKHIRLTHKTPVVKPNDENQSICSAKEDEIRSKQNQLIEKIHLLLYFKYIIERNQRLMRPQINIQFPSILIGYKDCSNGTIHRSLDGHNLEIKSSDSPIFFSIIDIFKGLKIPHEDILRQLKQYPMFAPYESMIMQQL